MTTTLTGPATLWLDVADQLRINCADETAQRIEDEVEKAFVQAPREPFEFEFSAEEMPLVQDAIAELDYEDEFDTL